jgi:hypothetical protein
MIASWIQNSDSPQVVSIRLSISLPIAFLPMAFNGIKSAEAIRQVMPRSATGRSRTA